MLALLSSVLITFITTALGQQAGSLVNEEHPAMPLWTCTSSGCTMRSMSVTLDANWRWLHTAQTTNCYSGSDWDTKICPDPSTCSENCQLEGLSLAQYESTYGVEEVSSGIELRFVTHTPFGTNYGSRLYMMDKEDSYKIFKLKNREFTFTVDVSKLPCGLNGALYFAEMEADGGLSSSDGKNTAGAKYGTGYCDAQCPHDIKFIKGEANIIGWNQTSSTPTGNAGSCCNEMDIWEANSRASAFTAHPCDIASLYRCNGTDCDKCDRAGCDFNSYRMGNETFFGRGKDFVVNTRKELTVVTQFITHDSTDGGDLVDIRRFYVQDNVVIPNSNSSVLGVHGNSISDAICNATKAVFGDDNDFARKGGLKAVGEALDRGMVLVFSLWDDSFKDMLWLDSAFPAEANRSVPGIVRGPCSIDSGSPGLVREKYPTASVKFTGVKVGSIGSTFGAKHTSPAEFDPFGDNRRLNVVLP